MPRIDQEKFEMIGEYGVSRRLIIKENRVDFKFYECPECRQKFKLLPKLWRHLLAKHGRNKWIQFRTKISTDQPFRCKTCNFALPDSKFTHNCQKLKSLLEGNGENDEYAIYIASTSVCPYCPDTTSQGFDVSYHFR